MSTATASTVNRRMLLRVDLVELAKPLVVIMIVLGMFAGFGSGFYPKGVFGAGMAAAFIPVANLANLDVNESRYKLYASLPISNKTVVKVRCLIAGSLWILLTVFELLGVLLSALIHYPPNLDPAAQVVWIFSNNLYLLAFQALYFWARLRKASVVALLCLGLEGLGYFQIISLTGSYQVCPNPNMKLSPAMFVLFFVALVLSVCCVGLAIRSLGEKYYVIG